MSGKGAAFERQCRQELADAGWLALRVSTDDIDLIAVRIEAGRPRVLICEVKSGRQRCRAEQWNRLVQLAEQCGATPVLADKAPGVRAAQWWEITGLKQQGSRGMAQPRRPLNIDEWDERSAA